MNRIARACQSPLVLLVFLFAMLCAGPAGAQAWTQLVPTGGPPAARYGHTAVYDAAGDNMIVFAGCATGACYANDVWVLGHANGIGGTPTWTLLTTSGGPPTARYAHTAVYDAAGNNMIMFDGNICPSSCGSVNDVWVLSHANGSGGTPTWTLLTTSSGPPTARYLHTAVYDAAGNNLIVFGGYSGFSNLNDVWVLSHANGSGGTPTWSLLTTSGGPPSARYAHTAVYDAAGNNMVVFGGYDGSFQNDVWVLSHANGSGGTPTWSLLTTSGGPPAAREYHTAVYDTVSNSMIVFGGTNSSGSLNDAWVLSHANGIGGAPAWTQLSPTGGPPTARFLHSAVYDTAGNNLIVFGGTSGSSNLNDVWVLSTANGLVNIAANIDIRPNTAVNTISLTNGTNIPVAILSSATFNAPTQVDKTSLRFGHSGNESSLIGCDLRATDVNADGYKDLVCHFNGTKGSFVMSDTTGYLKGLTTVGNRISGSDSVVIIK